MCRHGQISRSLFFLLNVLLIFTGISCKKMFDIKPQSQVDQSQAYRNVYDADAAVIGIYGKVMKVAKQYVLWNELRGDLMDITFNSDPYLRQLSEQNVTSNNPYINPQPFYDVILNCNDALKNFKIMLAVLILSLAMVGFTSCGGGEKEPNPLADSLSNLNGELNGKLSEKEAALQDFVSAFNEIQDNLNTIKEKEKIVTNSTKSGDVKSKEDQIKEDLQAIYDLIGKNKSRINSLSKKLKNANVKIKGFEEMIASLQAQIADKDNTIAELKSAIEALNIELSNLNTNYQEVEQEAEVKTEKLNTAYYAFGTSKELKEKGIITKEGGFIGIGKSTKVKDDFNKEYFTKIDVTTTASIPIGGKKAKILTTHPSSSYKLVGEKTVEKIDITNAEEFWSASKYLVIVID